MRQTNFDTAMGMFHRFAGESGLGTRVQHDCREGWCGTAAIVVEALLHTALEGTDTEMTISWGASDARSFYVMNGVLKDVSADIVTMQDGTYDAVEIPIEEIVAVAI